MSAHVACWENHIKYSIAEDALKIKEGAVPLISGLCVRRAEYLGMGHPGVKVYGRTPQECGRISPGMSKTCTKACHVMQFHFGRCIVMLDILYGVQLCFSTPRWQGRPKEYVYSETCI